MSCLGAARTMLAAGGGRSQVDRQSSRWACRWAGTAAPLCCGAPLWLVERPVRSAVHCGVLPADADGQIGATSPDDGDAAAQRRPKSGTVR